MKASGSGAIYLRFGVAISACHLSTFCTTALYSCYMASVLDCPTLKELHLCGYEQVVPCRAAYHHRGVQVEIQLLRWYEASAEHEVAPKILTRSEGARLGQGRSYPEQTPSHKLSGYGQRSDATCVSVRAADKTRQPRAQCPDPCHLRAEDLEKAEP